MATILRSRKSGITDPGRVFAATHQFVADLLLVAAASLVARIIAVVVVRPDPSKHFMFDPTLYYLLGYNIEHLKGFTVSGFPTAAVSPAYPVALAATFRLLGHDVSSGLTLNVVLGALTCAATYLLGRELFTRPVAIGAAVLLALMPNAALFASVLMAENLAAPLLILALYLAVREMRRGPVPRMPVLLAIGCLTAAGFLARGEMIMVVLAVPAAVLIAERNMERAIRWTVPIAAVCAVAAGAWIARNDVVMGRPVIATTSVSNGLYSSLGPYFQEFPPSDVTFAYPWLPRDRYEVESSKEQQRQALRYARSHPLEELRRIPLRFWWLFSTDEGALRWIKSDPTALTDSQQTWVAVVSNAVYAPAMLLMLFGLPFWLSHRDSRHMLLICVFAFWAAMHVLVFGGEPHYHVVLLPLIALFAAGGGSAMWARWRDRGREPHVAATTRPDKRTNSQKRRERRDARRAANRPS